MKQIWNPLLGLLILYTATVLPYRISFLNDEDKTFWDVFDIVFDTLFWFDLVINFVSAYYDEEGKLVRTRREVMLNYLRGWFLIDFLACFPFEQVFLIAFGSNGAD